MEHVQFGNRRSVLTRKLMLTATFAGLYAVFRLVPIDKAIGIPGIIAAGSVIIPIIAVFLDAPFAIATVIIGTFIASLAPWNPLRFYGLDFLPGTMNILVACLLIKGRRTLSALVFIGTLLVFVAAPNTETFVNASLLSPPIPYYWLHLVALLVVLSPLSKNIGPRLESGQYRFVAIALGCVAFTGTMLEHLTGGILSALVFGPGIVRFWQIFYVFYPIERVVLTILATLVGVPIVLNTRRIREAIMNR